MQKLTYDENMVEDLKTSNPGQWYSKLKRLSQLDPTEGDYVTVEELENLPVSAQAEAIADNFGKIANLYQHLKKENIDIPNDDQSRPIPLYEPHEVWQKIKSMKRKKTTVKGDIPWTIICEYSVELSFPLCNIYNTGTLNGEWLNIWKYVFVTPAPKVFAPSTADDLRKIYKALLSETILLDMEPNVDKYQNGNEKGLSIQHYFVNMVPKILTILDTNNDKYKYGEFSTVRDLPGGGPQGATMGLIEYKSNSNNNADHIPTDMKFKFVDDFSVL